MGPLPVPWQRLLRRPRGGAIFAGLGLANEKKAGYWGAIAVAVLNLLVLLDWFFQSPASIGIVISLMFGIVLLALLLHPMTRSYERIWFKRLSGR